MYAKIGATQVLVATYPSRGSSPLTTVTTDDCQEGLFIPFSKQFPLRLMVVFLIFTVKQVRT